MSAAQHAAAYVRRMGLVSQSLGALTGITVDDSRQVALVEWECGRVETFSLERFMELVKSAAARFGDAVPF